MTSKLLSCALALVLAAGSAWTADSPEKKMIVRAVLELSDGSRLVGTALEESFRLNNEVSTVNVPLARICQCEVRHNEERLVLLLQNGDKIIGTVGTECFPLQTTSLGKLTPSFALIDRITLTAWQEGGLPPGEGSISFGGVNWLPWKTLFEIQGDKLVTLPKARPGFNYGHDGNGRGSTLMSNIGNPEWKNYSVEFELCMTGVDPSFNPYGLPLDFRGAGFFFHVVDAKESQNECGFSVYMLSLSPDGMWSLSCTYNNYCAVPRGWGDVRCDARRNLGSGKGPKLDHEKANKFRVDVRGSRIEAWVDGEKIFNIVDEKMGDTIGGKTLDHGGVGFHWGFDSMGWIRNFSAKRL